MTVAIYLICAPFTTKAPSHQPEQFWLNAYSATRFVRNLLRLIHLISQMRPLCRHAENYNYTVTRGYHSRSPSDVGGDSPSDRRMSDKQNSRDHQMDNVCEEYISCLTWLNVSSVQSGTQCCLNNNASDSETLTCIQKNLMDINQRGSEIASLLPK